jgi:hypothetical protein
MFLLEFIDTESGFWLPLASPPQWSKAHPDKGVAVNVTMLPAGAVPLLGDTLPCPSITVTI